MDDYSDKPAIAMLQDINFLNTVHAKDVHNSSNSSNQQAQPRHISLDESGILRVKQGSGCFDHEKVVEVLTRVHGDANKAIAMITESMVHHDDDDDDNHGHGDEYNGPSNGETTHHDTKVVSSQHTRIGSDMIRVEFVVQKKGKKKVCVVFHRTHGQETESKGVHTSRKKGRTKTAGAPSRNARCPCGSTKKYKNCCGVSRKQTQTQQAEQCSASISNALEKVLFV